MNDTSNQTILQLIATAALKDKELKQALLEYIGSATKELTQTSDWREVWWQETKTPRVHVDEDRMDMHTGMTAKRLDVYVYMRVEYSESRFVAKTIAFLTGVPFSERDEWHIDNIPMLFSLSKPFWTAVHDVTDYADAIRCGQSDWTSILVEFENITESKDIEPIDE
jgi:hypothetical protein